MTLPVIEGRRATLTLFVGTIVGRAAMLIMAVFVARLLPQDAVATVLLGQAIGAYAVVAVELGLTTTGIRLVAGDPHEANRVVGLVVTARVAIAIAVVSVVALVAIALGVRSAPVFILWAAAMAATALDASWALQGLARPALRGVTLAVTGVGSLFLATLLLLVYPQPIAVPAGVLLGTLAGSMVGFIGTWLIVGRPRVGFEPRQWSNLLRLSVPLGIGSLLAQVYYNFDLLVLGAQRSATEVAIYGSLYKFVLGLQMLSITYGSLWMPRYARAHVNSTVAYLSLIATNGRRALVAGGLAAAALLAFGADLLGFVFGSSYSMGGSALGLLGIAVAVSFVSGVLMSALAAAGEGWLITRAIGVAVLLNLALNLLLIPQHGMIAAACATLVSEVAILVWLMASRGYLLRSLGWRSVVGPVTAACAFLAVGYAMRPLDLWPVAFASAVTVFGTVLVAVYRTPSEFASAVR